MAESLRSKFEEHLSCGICLEQLRDPKVLPCLHSYCHGCIAKLDMAGNTLTCPECRSTVEIPAPPDVSFLPSNFFAKNLLATMFLAAESDSGNIVCENCDGGEHPETRCQQCTRYLCQFCTEYHRRSRDTKTHTLSTLDELRESHTPVIAETIRCVKHETKAVKLYCKTCEETICRDCTIVDHRQHDYVFVRDVSQEKKDELMHLVEEVKQRRSEMSESLVNLKKMEENMQESNKSTIQKINQYFENMETVLESKKDEFLEEVTVVKNSKLKQLHFQQEEFELNLGSCDSSIEFTEQAFKNGNDVQILNLTKYMTRCLDNLKNKKIEIASPYEDPLEYKVELNEHALLCDRMAQFHFAEEGKNPEGFTAVLSGPRFINYLVVDEYSEVIIKRKEQTAADEDRGMITVIPFFEGVGVKDVSIVDKDDGSRIVRFCPIHVGELKLVACMTDGSRVPSCVLTTTVMKKKEIPEDCPIGDRIFESGIHTWKIKVDHTDCFMEDRVYFDVGIIDYASSRIVKFTGFVNDWESIELTLDMENENLLVKGSWNRRAMILDQKFSRVSPYFKSNCDECKLTVTAHDDWCFVRYKKAL